jgi:hypothetical protein
MARGKLPQDGELRIGAVTLPAGRRIRASFGSGDAVTWMTSQEVTDIPLIGWACTDQWQDALLIAAVLRSWEDRFGARLLQVGWAEIRLIVERPPRTLPEARAVAAEHFAFADECGGQGLSTVPAIAPSLINAPFWSFWWD